MTADRGRAAGGVVGLRKAAELAGVSVSTVRRWADQQRLPTYRTAGGHRRFRVEDLQQLLAPAAAPDGRPAPVLGDMAAARIRRQLAAPRARDLEWLGGISGHTRERLGLLGRQLLTVVEDYIAGRRPRAAVLTQARQFGLFYGHELAQAHLTVRQAIEAFTFFRRSLEDAARRYGVNEGFSAAQAEDLRDHLDVLNDRVLLGIAEAYDEAGTAAGAAQP
jgi:excisionase family DNA binding protein